MNNETITYVGCRGNLVDEAYLMINQKIFAPCNVVSDARTLGFWYGKQYSKVSLFGGGTILPFDSFWVRPNCYNYAFGVGVRDLSFSPEFYQKGVVEKTRRFNFRLLGVRGEQSRKTLQKWGIDSEVVGEPCLLLEPEPHIRRNQNLIGVNLSTFKAIWGNNANKIVSEGIKICNSLLEKGYSIILIPVREEDPPALKEISRVTGAPVFDRGVDVQGTLNLIASCKVLIGEILPSLSFSAAATTPFIMISYQQKCADFVDTVGFGKYAIRTDEVTCEKVITLVEDLLSNWNGMHDILIRNVSSYRKRLRDFADRIMDDIESRSLYGDMSSPHMLGELRWFAYQQLDRWLKYRYSRIWRVAHQLGDRTNLG
jgi:hypothetical protein